MEYFSDSYFVIGFELMDWEFKWCPIWFDRECCWST